MLTSIYINTGSHIKLICLSINKIFLFFVLAANFGASNVGKSGSYYLEAKTKIIDRKSFSGNSIGLFNITSSCTSGCIAMFFVTYYEDL